MDFGYFIVIEVMVILHISASEKILASQYFDVNSGLSKKNVDEGQCNHGSPDISYLTRWNKACCKEQ